MRLKARVASGAAFLPADLVPRLLAAVTDEGADVASAASGGGTHPVFGLWPTALAGKLGQAMETEHMRKIDRWTARYRVAYVEYGDEPVDPFFNVNRPGDLERAERLLGAETPAAGGQGADGRRPDLTGAA